jgi:hypothetical protein
MAAVAERRAQCTERRAKCEEERVELLNRRQTHLEKSKPAASEWPQAQITELFRQQLAEPWPGSTGIPVGEKFPNPQIV